MRPGLELPLGGGGRIPGADHRSPRGEDLLLHRLNVEEIHEHAVLSDVLQPRGSGFVASHGDELLLANNAQWIGFSLEVGPDGALYVLDWHDPDITGGSVPGKETGRVYRIAPERSLAGEWPDRYADLGGLSDARLAELQLSPSDWHARRARVILQRQTQGLSSRFVVIDQDTEELLVRQAEPPLRLVVASSGVGAHYRTTYLFRPITVPRHGESTATEVTVVHEGTQTARYGRLLAVVFGGLAARAVENVLRRDIADLAAAVAGPATAGPPVAA